MPPGVWKKEELVGKLILLAIIVCAFCLLIYSFIPFYKMAQKLEGGLMRVIYIPLGMVFIGLFLVRRALAVLREIRRGWK